MRLSARGIVDYIFKPWGSELTLAVGMGCKFLTMKGQGRLIAWARLDDTDSGHRLVATFKSLEADVATVGSKSWLCGVWLTTFTEPNFFRFGTNAAAFLQLPSTTLLGTYQLPVASL